MNKRKDNNIISDSELKRQLRQLPEPQVPADLEAKILAPVTAVAKNTGDAKRKTYRRRPVFVAIGSIAAAIAVGAIAVLMPTSKPQQPVQKKTTQATFELTPRQIELYVKCYAFAATQDTMADRLENRPGCQELAADMRRHASKLRSIDFDKMPDKKQLQ